ncbi:MAG: hypothetical protein ACJAZI_000596 [Cycloclasticus sp.]|jgi:hypothetical protein
MMKDLRKLYGIIKKLLFYLQQLNYLLMSLSFIPDARLSAQDGLVYV